MAEDELETLACRIEEQDTCGMSEWDDGFASGLKQAAKMIRNEIAQKKAGAPERTPAK